MLRFLSELRKRFLGKKPALFKSGQWHFHQDDAPVPQLHPCHRLFDQDWESRHFLTVPIVQTLLPDFWLFLKLKENLRSCRYETIAETKEAVTKIIDTITQEDFQGAFQKLLEWYNKCITAGGDYNRRGVELSCVYNQ